ncbi:myosin-11-like isoform X2 [Leptopilina heterotoma]|uniref:myosin-11-like isoform X2 n=1 Tax=Leptopilina heterotoma TaxID=63436 RepID=UPI001CA9E51D|nr:myosin-11-like isoform X2 [Leptopilina heterotoma]
MDKNTELENKEEKDVLHELQCKHSRNLKATSNLKHKLFQKSKLLELSNKKGENLERKLMTARSEIAGISRILELERQERQELESRTLNLIKGAKRKWENSEKNKVHVQTVQIAELRDKLQKTESELNTSNTELEKLKILQIQYKESLNKMKECSRQSAQGIGDNLKKMIIRSHDQLSEVQKQLELEKLKYIDLRDQNELIITENKQLQYQSKISESKLKDTLLNLESVKKEKETFELQLRTSLNTEENQLQKINKLEELLKKLQERELSDANLDKRLAIKTEEEKIKLIEEEKLKLMEELKKREEDDDKSIKVLKEIEIAKISLAELTKESENNKIQADLANKALTNSNKKNEKLQHSNALLRRELDASLREIRENQYRIDSLNKYFELKILKQNEIISEYEDKIEKLQKENNNCHVNDTLLKKACSILEEQLNDYEKLTNDFEKRENSLLEEKSKLQNDLRTLKSNIRKCKIVESEENTMRQIAEKAIEKLDAEMSDIENERDNLITERDEYKLLVYKLNKQITEISLKCSNLECDLSQMKQLVDMAKKETQIIKEENSQHLSKVYELKELNINLVSDLQKNANQCQALEMRVTEREDVMNEMRQFYKERETKAESNYTQQTNFKIDDYNKKKKGVYNKLFGLKKKENIEIATAVNYHELEKQLEIERTKVKVLMEQLLNTKISRLSSPKNVPSMEKKYNLLVGNVEEKNIVTVPIASSISKNLESSSECFSNSTSSPKTLTINEPDLPERDIDYLQIDQSTFIDCQTILKLEKNKLNLNCVLEIEEGVLLIGAEEGLYVYHCLQTQILKVIRGVKNVHQLSLHYNLGLALMIAEEERQLLSCSVKQFDFLSFKYSRPKINTKRILAESENNCHLYQVEGETICAATSSHIILLKWTLNGESGEFIKIREIKTQEPCSCVLFIKNNLIVGCNEFFQIDMTTFKMNDFPQIDDSSVRTDEVTELTGLKIFPIYALDVSIDLQTVEILLCYNEFGIFVNGSGQKIRCENLNWSHLPFAFAFSAPYLFVVHFSSVEIIKIDPDSLKVPSIMPERIILELNNPRYLGLSGKSIYISISNFILELLKIKGKSLTPGLSGSLTSIDSLSRNWNYTSDFSVMSNLTEVLDGRGRNKYSNISNE